MAGLGVRCFAIRVHLYRITPLCFKKSSSVTSNSWQEAALLYPLSICIDNFKALNSAKFDKSVSKEINYKNLRPQIANAGVYSSYTIYCGKLT